MSILDEIRNQLPAPEGFGRDVPYARFSRVDADRSAGEDITLEFQAGEAPGEPDLIVFSYSEWQSSPQGMATQPICGVTLDASTGEPHGLLPAAQAESVASVRAALAYADQMQLVA